MPPPPPLTRELETKISLGRVKRGALIYKYPVEFLLRRSPSSILLVVSSWLMNWTMHYLCVPLQLQLKLGRRLYSYLVWECYSVCAIVELVFSAEQNSPAESPLRNGHHIKHLLLFRICASSILHCKDEKTLSLTLMKKLRKISRKYFAFSAFVFKHLNALKGWMQ
jgi:hypothetical protein